jgi:glycosyltransferase involved in cell wall biosynthesis
MVAYSDYFTDARIKRYVRSLLARGQEVDVFTLGRPSESQPGLHVHYLGSKVYSHGALPALVGQLRFLMLAFLRIGVLAIGRRYGVVHVHNMPNFLVFAALVPRLLGARVILDVHDTLPEAYATKFNLPLNHPLIRLARLEERLSAAFAHHVITTHELHREALIEHGIAGDRISIVMNLADPTLFFPRPRARETGLTLIYHGTIAHRLGPDLILRAVHAARTSCPNLRLILIGAGEYMPAARELSTALELDDIVAIRSGIPVEELPALLATADVGIVGNRRQTEARRNWMLPVKMLEYAAMEIPTIAPRLRVITRYFDNQNAVLYEPDDVDAMARCIRELYEHPDRIEQLRLALREFNSRYSWQEMENRYLDLIDDLAPPAGLDPRSAPSPQPRDRASRSGRAA